MRIRDCISDVCSSYLNVGRIRMVVTASRMLSGVGGVCLATSWDTMVSSSTRVSVIVRGVLHHFIKQFFSHVPRAAEGLQLPQNRIHLLAITALGDQIGRAHV